MPDVILGWPCVCQYAGWIAFHGIVSALFWQASILMHQCLPPMQRTPMSLSAYCAHVLDVCVKLDFCGKHGL